MVGIQVKASRRNGKIVKAHTRRGKAIRNAAIGLAGAGAIAGGGLLLKKKLGLKSTGTALARPIRIDGRAAAMGRTGKAGARQQREAIIATQRRLGPAGMREVQRQLTVFDKVSRLAAQGQISQKAVLKTWINMDPDSKRIGLANIAASGGSKAAREFRTTLLKGYRQSDETLIGREKGFNKLKAYGQHFKAGGDRAGQRMSGQQFRKLRDSARDSGGRSAAGIRANIRRDLGFSGRPDLTLFRKLTASEIKQIRSAKSRGERRGRKFRQQLTRKWRKA